MAEATVAHVVGVITKAGEAHREHDREARAVVATADRDAWDRLRAEAEKAKAATRD